MLALCVPAWTVVLIVYGAVTWSYPRDRRVAELKEARRCAEDAPLTPWLLRGYSRPVRAPRGHYHPPPLLAPYGRYAGGGLLAAQHGATSEAPHGAGTTPLDSGGGAGGWESIPYGNPLGVRDGAGPAGMHVQQYGYE